MKDKRIYFSKMLEYTYEAQGYIKGVTYEQFTQNKEKIAACSFAICQISELAQRIGEEDKKKVTSIPWVPIRAMRNRIVHDYDSINKKILWDTITEDLPRLAQELESISKA
jgi:uncharacterized protein with HEPN domain